MPAQRGRFAPSPTGDLHAGSLLAALGSWLFARAVRGQWIVRIEDVDQHREVPGAAARQMAALHAFGLRPDAPVERQTARYGLYEDALRELRRQGLAFDCYCSRTDLAAAGGIHRDCVRGPRAGRHPAVRFRVPPGVSVRFDDAIQGTHEQDVHAEVGDFVLFRADGQWAYQLAVVVDDGDQGITQVVRGADLLDSTPRQILLHRALGLPVPTFAHLPLLCDDAGRKLSKSAGDGAIDPTFPTQVLHRAWSRLGQVPHAHALATDVAVWLDAAAAAFEPSRIPRRLDPDTAGNEPARVRV